LYPTEAGNLSDLTGELEIAIPTQLSGDEYWDEAFESDNPFTPTVNPDWYESGVHALNLTVNKSDLKINTVGIQAEPESEVAKVGVGYEDSPDDGVGSEIVFESLSATTAVKGQSLNEVTFDYSLSKSATVSFEIVGINSVASTGSSGSVTVDGEGADVTQTIRANISGGECYEYEIPQGTQSETIDLLIEGGRC
jgi:hypothetical protein